MAPPNDISNLGGWLGPLPTFAVPLVSILADVVEVAGVPESLAANRGG